MEKFCSQPINTQRFIIYVKQFMNKVNIKTLIVFEINKRKRK